MAQLASWVKGLIVLLLLAGVIEMVAPEGGSRKFVRLAMGLVVLLCVLQPVASMLGRPGGIEPGLALPAGSSDLSGSPAPGSRSTGMTDRYASIVERQLELCAGRIDGVERVDAQVELSWGDFGGHPVRAVRFEVRLAEGDSEEVKGTLLTLAAKLYGVRPELVDIRFLE